MTHETTNRSETMTNQVDHLTKLTHWETGRDVFLDLSLTVSIERIEANEQYGARTKLLLCIRTHDEPLQPDRERPPYKGEIYLIRETPEEIMAIPSCTLLAAQRDALHLSEARVHQTKE